VCNVVITIETENVFFSQEFNVLLKDEPTFPDDFVPGNRLLPPGTKLKTGVDDLVVECAYKTKDEMNKWGGIIDSNREDFCFGVITVKPELPLATCTSIPTETSLEVILGVTFSDEYELPAPFYIHIH